MNKLLCLLLLFAAQGSYCQENFYDYVEGDNMYDYLTIPVRLDHDAFHDKLVVDSTFKAQTARIHEFADYYIDRARQVDVRHLVIKIIDAKYKYMMHERMINVCELERERTKNIKEQFTRDTAANVTLENGVIEAKPASLYKALHAIADYYKLKLDLKGPIEQYGMPIEFTLYLNELKLNQVLCIIHACTGFCSNQEDNKLIVQGRSFNNCKLNCKE